MPYLLYSRTIFSFKEPIKTGRNDLGILWRSQYSHVTYISQRSLSSECVFDGNDQGNKRSDRNPTITTRSRVCGTP